MPVYIVRVGEAGPIKIGWASDLRRRLGSLRAAHHEPLNLIRTIDTVRFGEVWLHGQFKHLRIRGDWFNFDPAMLTICVPDDLPDPKRKNGVVRKIIRQFGGQTALGELLGVSQSVVSDWAQKDFIPGTRIVSVIRAGAALEPPIMLEPNDFFDWRSAA